MTDTVTKEVGSEGDINFADVDGRTALYRAADSCVTSPDNTKRVKQLIEAGANLNIPDEKGKTPLNIASWNGRTEVVKLLIEAGADLNAADSMGDTPLRRALQMGRGEVVKLLIEAGADLNSASYRGHTPLSAATVRNDMEMVKLLIESGADIEAVDFDTRIKLDAAFGHTKLVELVEAAAAAKDFISRAVVGAARCRISITRIPGMAGNLSRALQADGVPADKMKDLFNDALLGICPKCHKYCSGPLMLELGTGFLGAAALAAGDSIRWNTDVPGGGPRQHILAGECINASCSSREYELFWCPDLDAKMREYLESTYRIELNDNMQAERSCLWRPK